MIRSVVFDIGRVLLLFDFDLALRRILPLCDEAMAKGFPPRVEEVKIAYEAGQIGREEFLREAFELLGYRGTEAEFIAAWEEIFEENTPMIRSVQCLKEKGIPVYLLSNTSDIHVDYMLRKYPFFSLFDDAVYSYRVRCAKPDPAIYQLAAQQFGVNPGETLFIDDLPANISSAQEVGFHAIQYDYRDHSRFLNEVEPMGVPFL